jgi:hypothetical protein
VKALADVRRAHNGLELWYATADAPAPLNTVERRDGVSVTVGVRPARPSNIVRIRYRVDGREQPPIAALRRETDYAADRQYFRATFPTFWTGRRVEYLPILWSGGRWLAADGAAATSPLPALFEVDQTLRPTVPLAEAWQDAAGAARYPFTLEYLVTKRVSLAPQPELIGETPEGFVMHWSPTGGTVDGPAFRATVHADGEHEMIVRPDGVGEQSVRVTLETDDHALISVRYSGLIDLGAAGVARVREGHWPVSAQVRSAPRLITAHPKYLWLNRLQCFAVGEVRPFDLLYIYDLYAVR